MQILETKDLGKAKLQEQEWKEMELAYEWKKVNAEQSNSIQFNSIQYFIVYFYTSMFTIYNLHLCLTLKKKTKKKNKDLKKKELREWMIQMNGEHKYFVFI
jgi:hypothetical protein